jgi:hypothetical protein
MVLITILTGVKPTYNWGGPTTLYNVGNPMPEPTIGGWFIAPINMVQWRIYHIGRLPTTMGRQYLNDG